MASAMLFIQYFISTKKLMMNEKKLFAFLHENSVFVMCLENLSFYMEQPSKHITFIQRRPNVFDVGPKL